MEPNLINFVIRTSRGLFGASMARSTMTILWWYRVYEYRITKENCGELVPLQITSLNSILGDPGAANWDRIFRSLTATDKVNEKNRRAS